MTTTTEKYAEELKVLVESYRAVVEKLDATVVNQGKDLEDLRRRMNRVEFDRTDFVKQQLAQNVQIVNLTEEVERLKSAAEAEKGIDKKLDSIKKGEVVIAKAMTKAQRQMKAMEDRQRMSREEKDKEFQAYIAEIRRQRHNFKIVEEEVDDEPKNTESVPVVKTSTPTLKPTPPTPPTPQPPPPSSTSVNPPPVEKKVTKKKPKKKPISDSESSSSSSSDESDGRSKKRSGKKKKKKTEKKKKKSNKKKGKKKKAKSESDDDDDDDDEDDDDDDDDSDESSDDDDDEPVKDDDASTYIAPKKSNKK